MYDSLTGRFKTVRDLILSEFIVMFKQRCCKDRLEFKIFQDLHCVKNVDIDYYVFSYSLAFALFNST